MAIPLHVPTSKFRQGLLVSRQFKDIPIEDHFSQTVRVGWPLGARFGSSHGGVVRPDSFTAHYRSNREFAEDHHRRIASPYGKT
jgi:hypothetical protein